MTQDPKGPPPVLIALGARLGLSPAERATSLYDEGQLQPIGPGHPPVPTVTWWPVRNAADIARAVRLFHKAMLELYRHDAARLPWRVEVRVHPAASGRPAPLQPWLRRALALVDAERPRLPPHEIGQIRDGLKNARERRILTRRPTWPKPDRSGVADHPILAVRAMCNRIAPPPRRRAASPLAA